MTFDNLCIWASHRPRMVGSRKIGAGASTPAKATPEPTLSEASSEGRYRIQVVAERTGVPAATLRAWERRYGIPVPARTQSSYRLYSDRDIELVRLLNAHCEAGMSPAEAARMLRERDETPAEPPATTDDVYDVLVRRMMDAVNRFDTHALETELSQVIALGSPTTVFERVVSPLQVQVGDRWHEGTLTTAQEHWVTETLESAMRALHRVVQPAEADRLVLLACFAEELHTLPLYGAAFRFSSWGYRAVVLGARTPPSALEAARVSLDPDLIGLSCTVPPPAEQAQRLVQAYAAACAPTPWAVGGRGSSPIRAHVEAAGGWVMTAADWASGVQRARIERLVRARGAR